MFILNPSPLGVSIEEDEEEEAEVIAHVLVNGVVIHQVPHVEDTPTLAPHACGHAAAEEKAGVRPYDTMGRLESRFKAQLRRTETKRAAV